MRRGFAALAFVVVLGACGSDLRTSLPSASAPALTDAEAAVGAALRLASVAGPLRVTEIDRGLYGDLFRGSTNDLSGQAAADLAAKAASIVWRITVVGPNGQQELYLDEASGALIDAITQGT